LTTHNWWFVVTINVVVVIPVVVIRESGLTTNELELELEKLG